MKKQRLDRVNSLLKEVIVEVIQRDVHNPRVTTFVSVTKVDVSPDLHHAKVYISLIATDAEKEKTLQALQSAAGFIAVHASKKVKLRYFPQLTFILDKGLEEHMRIHKILADIERERRNHLGFPEEPVHSDEQTSH
jgi:ribosome-binding factor A